MYTSATAEEAKQELLNPEVAGSNLDVVLEDLEGAKKPRTTSEIDFEDLCKTSEFSKVVFGEKPRTCPLPGTCCHLHSEV